MRANGRKLRGIHWPKLTRDGFLLALGTFGFLHEVLVVAAVRSEIVLGSLALMGVPFMLRADEARKRNEGGS